MSPLTKAAATLATTSRTGSTPKDILDDLVSLTFNLLGDSRLNAHSGLYSHIYCNPAYTVDMGRYSSNPEAWAQLHAMVMLYMQEVQQAPPFSDVLGEPYSAHVGKVLGQYLTPPSLAAYATTLSSSGEDGTCVVRMVDQCCGAGALLLGAIRDEYARHGRTGVGRLCVYASDLDIQMCRLAAVQMALSSIVHGVPVLVLHVQNLDAISDAHLLGKDDGLVMNATRILA